jgi:radical SAM superfamily enzyme YgiQ (UPF0313 family)
MPKSIYLINPKDDCPGYEGAEVLQAWGIANKVVLADLTMPTVAALAPASWTIKLCDERIEPVDMACDAEVIGITGKTSQRRRMIELAREFRGRGRLVVIGGPYASLDPEDMRSHADILVRGEIEDIAGTLFGDIAAGSWQAEYHGGKPDLSRSPIPRWDLTRGGVALWGQVQTSRGCPFECEFCDVIQYLGRKQRWKEPDQVIRELDVLYSRGYRGVFFADDNLTVMRRRTRALLEALEEWNSTRTAGRVAFATQVSIDIARDPELLALCRAAGFRSVFIGVETPNEASLAETKKRQNLRVDLAEQIGRVVAAGMLVTCGMIVGFDHDDPSIFERQAEFINRLATPLIQVNMLVAPAATPLYSRLLAEGRIVQGETHTGSLLETNIRPKLMSSQQLKSGARWLVNNVYTPAAFGRRLEAFVETCDIGGHKSRVVPAKVMHRALARRLALYGNDEHALLALFDKLAQRRPELVPQLDRALLYYCQARYIFDASNIWDPSLVGQNVPLAA